MKKFTTLNDIHNLQEILAQALELKQHPFSFSHLGKQKTLVMLFFNASLRTRLSTEKAAKNLGMEVSVLNIANAWNLEFENGTIMNLNTSEHIKEAAEVISQYADIIAVRAFPSLKNKEQDTAEYIINSFLKYASVPIVNMESATAHPLQALADAITIKEANFTKKPNIVLSWAPHPKALPHSVANSFVNLMHKMDVNFTITHPKGYELDPAITKNSPIEYDQQKAFENADIVYTKNWSSFNDYGKVLLDDEMWMITKKNLKEAKFMHCLPIRRNVVAEDAVLDSPNSLVIQQANNRTFATQIVLQQILMYDKMSNSKLNNHYINQYE